MQDTEHKTLAEILELLTDIRNLLKVSSTSQIRDVLENTLRTTGERQAYQLSDGVRTQVEIAKEVKVTQPTLSNWWRKWNQCGISLDSKLYAGRQQRVFDLTTYGIRVESIQTDKDVLD